MTDEEINVLWQQSSNDAEGMKRGYTTQKHYFTALVAEAKDKEIAAMQAEIDRLQHELDAAEQYNFDRS